MLMPCISIVFTIFLSSHTLYAQNYDSSDTITEYPNKGTYYHDLFVGRKTACGDIFDQNAFTAAHWKIKMGTLIMVTNQNTGLQVIVKVNDRCPKHGVIDLSHRAANAIGIRGCQPVTIRLLGDGYEERWASQDSCFDSVAVNHRKSTPAKTDTPKDEPTVETKATTEPVATTKLTLPPLPKNASTSQDTYGICLATVTSHGEAYDITRRLPQIYKDKVRIEILDGSDYLSVILDVRLQKKQADELRRALHHSFPNAKVVPTE